MNNSLWQATIRLSRPGSSVTDDDLTDEIIDGHSLAKNSARAIKNLWGSSIQPINAIERRIRKDFHRLTFSGIGSIRLVVLAERETFLARMSEHQSVYETTAAQFITDYEDILEKEKQRFAASHPDGVFKIEDYPTKASLAEAFGFTYSVLPMPEPSAFLTEHFAADASARLAAEYEQKLAAAHKNVRDAVLRTMLALISDTAVSLSGDGPIFDAENRKGPFAKLQDYLDRVPGLLSSLGTDPEIEAVYAACRNKLSVSADHLKSNKVFRQNAAMKAKSIALEFGGALGKRKLTKAAKPAPEPELAAA
jgi:hypothetical protein